MWQKEADTVYKELTMSRQFLKQNCTRSPPYDWSDIESYPKDQAMARLASGGSEETRIYWLMGEDYRDPYAPNWVARWFLYHKFRYRDGRNRGKDLKAKRDIASVTQAYKTPIHARKEDAYVIPSKFFTSILHFARLNIEVHCTSTHCLAHSLHRNYA